MTANLARNSRYNKDMSPIRTKPHTLPRRLLITLLILCAAGCVLAYTLFQARFLIEGPQLTLTSEPNTLQHDRQVILEGVAENITAISLNGRPIVTSESGVFEESVVLENGYTVVRIEAQDRYGRTTSLERTFVYEPSGPSVTLVD